MAIPSIPKPLILLPLMYYSRGLDTQDDDLVFKLRAAFYTVHAIIISVIVYLYLQASAYAAHKEAKVTVFVQLSANPFDTGGKKKYNETVLGTHMLTTTRNLLGSTLFMVAVQTGFHFYKGTISGLMIQAIMGPMNFLENPMVKFFLLGEADAVECKKREELTDDDEVVDAEGNPVGASKAVTATPVAVAKAPRNFEDVLLDTWDMGAEADVGPLMAALMKQNVNYQTKDGNDWTPVMIMAGLGVKETASALGTMKDLGADLSVVDAEGWNALHWSAFHGSAQAAKVLMSADGFDGASIGIHLVKDKEGKTPLEHAKAEGNEDVVAVISSYVSGKDDSKENSNGLRKRK